MLIVLHCNSSENIIRIVNACLKKMCLSKGEAISVQSLRYALHSEVSPSEAREDPHR
uniref:Uncharacterized protein n=1 Tax=Anguilla anguilla TaxID=7936 RepID=A0A0E9PAY4_ANGAN